MASVVLTAVGFAVGGPLGASIGGFIGSQIDQALFAPTVKSEGPRLGDLTVQTSSYGQPIPRIWGAENRVSGNIIWSTGLVETKTTKKQGGKGGGTKTESTTYSYRVDVAIGLCRGPIANVRRIWADGKLFRDENGVQKQAQALRIYTGTDTQNPDPTIQAAEGAANTPAYRDLAYVVMERLELADFGNRIPNFTFEIEAQSSATVATVIEELASEAGVPYLDSARADYLDLRGYTVARAATIRGLLEPLRSAFFFDMSEIEGELQFFPVDATPVARTPTSDLGAHSFGTDRPAPYETKRISDVELPRQVTVQHMDPARDYQVNSQRSRRSTVNSNSDLSVDLPIVLEASEGKAIAEQMVSMARLRRNDVITSLPIDYLHVEPGNKIVAELADGKDRVLRVVRKENRLPRSIYLECETDGAAVLSKSATAAAAPVPSQEVHLPGVTVAHLMDLPILRDGDESSSIYVVANGASQGWRGAVLYRSLDGGTNYDSLTDLTDGAVIGTIAEALGAASAEYWDRANTIIVELLSSADTLESVSELQLLNGANGCLIGDEIVQFQTATLVAPGTYELSGLLRGRKGTEDKIAGHTSGERFVLLSGLLGVVRQELPISELGATRQYRAVSVGTLLADAPTQVFTYTARALQPYSVVHVKGNRDGGGDLSISWIRRSRLDAQWLDHIDVPLGETEEAYQIDIMNGATVARTIAVSAPSATYTAEEQAADFGSAQPTITVRIYQMSSRVGRGLPKEAIL